MAKNFVPPVVIPTSVREVRTFGNSSVKLLGLVQIQLQLCGLQITHPFHFVDLPAPLIGGYDLMQAAKLVVEDIKICVRSVYVRNAVIGSHLSHISSVSLSFRMSRDGL